jgi:hypothetical protein
MVTTIYQADAELKTSSLTATEDALVKLGDWAARGTSERWMG